MKPGAYYSSIRQGKIDPVYFFHGAEDFLIDDAVEALLKEGLKDGNRDFNLDIVSAGEVQAHEVVARAISFPMMAERRMVILKDFERLGQKELIHSYIEDPCPTTTLILISKKSDRGIGRGATVVEFRRLFESQLPEWIIGRGAMYGKEIVAEAAEVLLTYVGDSLRALDREIEKISIFVSERKNITAEDVRAVVGISKTYNVFELTRAIGNRNLRRSLEIFERMIEVGESPVLMVAMLTKLFTDLLKLSTGKKQKKSEKELAAIINATPYRVKEYVGHLAHFSHAELEQSFALLTVADEKLKFSSENPRSVMTVLIHELLR